MSHPGKPDSPPPTKTSHREIERKFLVARLPDGLNAGIAQRVVQGYLAITADGSEVRLRRLDGRFLQTVKSGTGRERNEWEIELTRGQFEGLWPATVGKQIVKTRAEIVDGANVFELDRFEDALTGLVIVEVEFDTPGDADAFQPPSWFGVEVTDDERYKNRNLALHGVPKR